MDMKKAIFNIFLIIALAAVILMVVGIFLYDYIPSSSTVKDTNIYETSSDVTKIIAEIDDTKSSLGVSTNSSNSTGTTGLVLKTYSITETDLAIYSASGSYNSGKSDPFADVETSDSESSSASTSTSTSSTSGNTTTSSSSTSSNTSSSSSTSNTSTTSTSSTTSTNTSDGTLFNSTSSK